MPALACGVTPRSAWVDVDAEVLSVRFGPWSLRTPVRNIVDAVETSDFAYLKTAGPPHLSFKDRGITFATNGDRGLCLLFDEPVKAIDWIGLLRHPGATLTVADVAGLRRRLRL
jgi:hypothetical protein